MENKVRIRFIGDRSALGRKVIEKMRMSETQTEKNEGLTLTIALNYSGRDDLVRAFGRIVEDAVSAQLIDETLISSYLDTAGIPNPDLIIRTGGEHRISNFLLWQSAYSEFYTSSRYWPDFNEKEFDKALNAYGKRERRFGGLG
jgi:undecaprenyl diphosphate synthase